MAEWFVFHNGSENGPFSNEAFLAFLKGKDPAAVHIWREGLDGWVLAKTLPSLAAAMAPAEPVRPAKPKAIVAGQKEPGASTSKATGVPWPTVSPRDRAEQRVEIEQGAASPTPSTSIAISADDKFPEADDDESAAHKSMWSWAQYGALIGVVIGLIDIFYFRRGSLPAQGYIGAIFYFLGYVSACAAPFALLGFIAGAIRDRLRKNPPTEAAIVPGDIASAVSTDAAAGETLPVRRFNNVFAKHWRGDLPLWVSYWVVTFAVNLFAGAIPLVIARVFNIENNYYPPAVFVTIATVWLAVGAIAVWQNVGVWRSAKRYIAIRTQAGRHRVFGRLAQAVVIVGCLLFVIVLARTAWPQLREATRIAFLGDPGIPAYSIRVMRDGTEAEIAGGFKYGLTNDFSNVLSSSPGVKIVHLDSIGGRIGEGRKLFQLIRERKLTTYVARQCMSACTLAFAGGRERYLANGASLGFHKGTFPGATEAHFDDAQFAIFKQAGFEPDFITRALSTPHKDMWTPSTDILSKAKVITGVVDRDRFAASGFTGLNRDDLSNALVKQAPLYASLKRKYPQQYESLLDDFFQGLQKGATEQENITTMRGKLMPFVRSLLPLADDDVMIELNSLVTEQYAALRKRNPTSCYLYASGTGLATADLSAFSAELVARENALYGRVVDTATKRPEIDSKRIDRLMLEVRKRLIAKGITEDELDILTSTDLDAPRHARYCDLSVQLYREIGALARGDAVALMREMMSPLK